MCKNTSSIHRCGRRFEFPRRATSPQSHHPIVRKQIPSPPIDIIRHIENFRLIRRRRTINGMTVSQHDDKPLTNGSLKAAADPRQRTARRTREIGVRVALGARPLDVLTIVFKRPFVQMALGIGVGAILGFSLANDDLSKVHLDVLGNAAIFVLSTILCCALACIVPTRRALRIQPTEALKHES